MGNSQGRYAEQTIMSPLSTKVLLCIVLCLSICQYTQSLYLESDNPIDAIVLDENNNKVITNPPYMVMVHRFYGDKYRTPCAGTILSKRWVLTAAHCVERIPGTVFVDFGIDELGIVQGISRLFVFSLITQCGIGHSLLRLFSSVLMISTQAFIHPLYVKGVRHYNDIALLYMPQDIPFSSNIQPVKLAYYESFMNKDAYVVGWKENNMEGVNIRGPLKLKYATLPIIENNVCRQYWPINDNYICTARLGQFSCPERNNSDPLIVRKNGQDFQIGIMNNGDSCPSKKPYLFTKVSSYIDWIREVMKRH